jgi:uncharacterized protein DUF4154
MVPLKARRAAARLQLRARLPMLLCVLWLIALLLPAARGESKAPDGAVAESQIKAAFVCRFGNYIEWPATKAALDGAFVIGALTDRAGFDELTRAAAGRTVNGRPIVVRQLGAHDDLDDVSILYVARTHEARLAEMLAPIRQRPILTITETEEAFTAGSIVNFVVVEDKVRFDIALPAAEQSSLKISGRLLALARKVVGAPS